MINVEKQLEDARQNLLDLTMRNRLLNFRPTKAKTIEIVDEIHREIYDYLIIQEKKMGFSPIEDDDEDNIDSDDQQQDSLKEESKSEDLNSDASKSWELLPSDGDIATRYTDRYLQTKFQSENLQKRLLYLSQQSRSALEEQGYTILYLALGFIEWTESQDSIKPRRAPLLLIPVELGRAKTGVEFELEWTGEDIFANISLEAKLDEQGILLPDFQQPDEKHSIDSYFQSVAEAISKKSGWRVLNDIYLDFFNFKKFVMYKDLDSTAWPDDKKPSDHLLIKSLFGQVTQDFDSSFSEDDVDKRLDVRDQYHVMDADPSQIAVIEDVKSGRNLVVEGPPGTGKSQTITNIIAELLAMGMSVLFVSEKMAALEVVKNRLDDVGIGEFCLELHSRKSNKKFVGDLHETKILKFMKLDELLIEKNRGRLAQKLSNNRPNIYANVQRNSELGIIQSQFNRKRGHMPIRKLMINAGGLIQKIKPCFMMSLLSIAQFLDPKAIKFDVVVFDEASQVKPEDSFGALLRGNQAVVIGDTRQLPPTSFFDSIVNSDGEDDDENDSIKDIESILHLCKSNFQTKTLRWHYRSKHESLIAVSNQQFYDNRLVIYPSPIDNRDDLGLKFRHLPNASYDRGKSRVNRIEARAVAKAAVEHYRKYPDKSLGIGTFNTPQQQAILDEVDLQFRKSPEMENFFKPTNHDHFFVKNLENIQGDERDVIFISIGYGYDQNRKLSTNFGPINKDGGERRLNVLITRAREKCVVFSNFQAKDIPINTTSSLGLRSLKVFLDYAENRNLISMESESVDSDSPFEDSVYDLLQSHGYHVQKQVGCAGYRIDLALIDPKFPGRYLLGIECDGAKYHSSPVARDRDRLRQQNIEKLGWKIYRIWSTDWYRNRAECIQKLLKSIEFAISNSEKEPEPFDVSINSYDSPMQITESDEADQQDDVDNLYAEDRIDENIPDYVLCSFLNVDMYGQLHEQPREKLAEAIKQIAEIESPVHIEEVVRRIRIHHGLGRAGNRIMDAIDRAATYAMRMGYITRKGNFIWSNNCTVQVRCRRGDPPAKIEHICDEEIAEAIKMVLNRQFATPLNDLIVQSSRLFGIQATREAITKRIRKVIDSLMKLDELQYLSNGKIYFKNEQHEKNARDEVDGNKKEGDELLRNDLELRTIEEMAAEKNQDDLHNIHEQKRHQSEEITSETLEVIRGIDKKNMERMQQIQLLSHECNKAIKIGEQEEIKRREKLASQNNSIGMKFIQIPAGEFIMGSDEYNDEKPVHKVNIRKPFYLGTYPVTQREWKAVMGDNPSYFKGEDLPVEKVSWDDVQKFIKKLNKKEGTDKYRLPSEAEWEYACRASTKYSFGDSESKLGEYAWYDGNSGGKTHPVCQKKPNLWGLYDMHGNVFEWVQDTWHDDYDGIPSDGSVLKSGGGANRVFRGSSWFSNARDCRAKHRDYYDSDRRNRYLGFRLLSVNIPDSVVQRTSFDAGEDKRVEGLRNTREEAELLARTWSVPSDSDPSKAYTVKYSNFNNQTILKCNCPAWKFNTRKNRTCKHTDRVVRMHDVPQAI